MVRATVIVTALVALVASVAAVPRPDGRIVNLETNYVGAGNVNLQDALSDVIDVGDIDIHDILQHIDLLKRGEAAAPPTVRIARKAGQKGKKSSKGKENANNEKTA